MILTTSLANISHHMVTLYVTRYGYSSKTPNSVYIICVLVSTVLFDAGLMCSGEVSRNVFEQIVCSY